MHTSLPYRRAREFAQPVVLKFGGTTETTVYLGGLLEKLTRGAIAEYNYLIQERQQ